MTREDKDLLIKDLCARLPYGVKGLVTFNGNIFKDEDRTIDGKLYDRFAEFQDLWYDNVTIKPYLFPISSMTEEQQKETPFETSLLNAFLNGYISLFEDEELTVDDIVRMLDWLNTHHFDYRGLIEKGLAIDATGLNIY